MKKGVYVVSGIVLILIFVGIIYFNFFWKSKEEKIERLEHENLKMGGELREVLLEVIQEQKQKGIEISIEEIQTFSQYQGYVKLNCEEELSLEDDEKIIESMVTKLVERYPEDYGEDGKLWFDVEACSMMGTSPSGFETYYHPTEWMVSNGDFGPRI